MAQDGNSEGAACHALFRGMIYLEWRMACIKMGFRKSTVDACHAPNDACHPVDDA